MVSGCIENITQKIYSINSRGPTCIECKNQLSRPYIKVDPCKLRTFEKSFHCSLAWKIWGAYDFMDNRSYAPRYFHYLLPACITPENNLSLVPPALLVEVMWKRIIVPYNYRLCYCSSFCLVFRLDQLIMFYGSWEAAFFYGLRYIRQLFPQLGISVEEFDADLLTDSYPGGLSLYDFVVTSAHSTDNMIIL